MPFNPGVVQYMRDELVNIGVKELTTPEEVENWFSSLKDGILIFNSMCGCTGSVARAAIRIAVENSDKRVSMASVFAGQDIEATKTARDKISELPPSSPSIVFFKNGKVAYFMKREEIQGRPEEEVADTIKELIEKFY